MSIFYKPRTCNARFTDRNSEPPEHDDRTDEEIEADTEANDDADIENYLDSKNDD